MSTHSRLILPGPPPLTTNSFTAHECRLALALALHIKFQDNAPLDCRTISDIMYSICSKPLSAGFPNFERALECYRREEGKGGELGEGTEWPRTADAAYKKWLDPYGELMEMARRGSGGVRIPES